MDTFTLGQLVLAAVPKEALPEMLSPAFLSAGLREKEMTRTKGLPILLGLRGVSDFCVRLL